MNQPKLAPPLAGNIPGSPNDSFVIAEWQDAGGPSGPPRLIAPRHVHHNDDEAWYVLEGTLRLLAGENEIEASAGSAVLVPRGTPHTYWNPGPGRVRYLLIMAPNIFGLIQGIHALDKRTPESLSNCSGSTIPSSSKLRSSPFPLSKAPEVSHTLLSIQLYDCLRLTRPFATFPAHAGFMDVTRI